MLKKIFLRITVALSFGIGSLGSTATAIQARLLPLRHNAAAFNWKIGGMVCRSIKPVCTTLAITGGGAQEFLVNPDEPEATLSPQALAAANILELTALVCDLASVSQDNALHNGGVAFALSSAITTNLLDLVIHIQNIKGKHVYAPRFSTSRTALHVALEFSAAITDILTAAPEFTPELQTALYNLRTALDTLDKMLLSKYYPDTDSILPSLLTVVNITSLAGNTLNGSYYLYEGLNRDTRNIFVRTDRELRRLQENHPRATDGHGNCPHCQERYNAQRPCFVFGSCGHGTCLDCAVGRGGIQARLPAYRGHVQCHTCDRMTDIDAATQEAEDFWRDAHGPRLNPLDILRAMFQHAARGGDDNDAAPAAPAGQLIVAPAAGADRRAWKQANHIVGDNDDIGCPACLSANEELAGEQIIRLHCGHIICRGCCQAHVNQENAPADRGDHWEAHLAVAHRRRYACPTCRAETNVENLIDPA